MPSKYAFKGPHQSKRVNMPSKYDAKGFKSKGGQSDIKICLNGLHKSKRGKMPKNFPPKNFPAIVGSPHKKKYDAKGFISEKGAKCHQNMP